MTDLTDLATVKAYLGIASSDASADAVLSRLISAASSWFVRKIGRELDAMSVVEIFNGRGTFGYSPRRRPVNSVASLTIDDVYVPARASIGDSGYAVVDDRIELIGHYFTEGIANVRLEYNGGHATIPGDVKEAVTRMTADVHRARPNIGQAAKTSVAGESVTFRPDALPTWVQSIIDSYREPRMT